MKEFDKIYLSWRKGISRPRYIVGTLEQTPGGKFQFAYDQEEVNKAIVDGFSSYTEFPDFEKTYNGNVLDIFGQRLIKSERPDIQSFYKFWEIAPQFNDDKFYLLGHTQGLLPTDNFEFLADYNIVDGLSFLTEIAGLSVNEIQPERLNVGDVLRFELDKNNKFDKDAVKVFKGNDEIGFIKKVHSRIFHKPGAEKLKLSVKAVDKNGKLKRAFIKISA